MKETTPLVSVIMPAFNAEDYISAAIESILNQSYQNFELLVINDCSSDSTEEIINSFNDSRIKLIKNQKNLRIALSKNKAAKLAKGKYLVSMDADDISNKHRIQTLVDFMENNAEIGICGSAVQLIDKTGSPIRKMSYPLEDRKIRKFIFKFSPYTHGTICVRKNIFDQIGGYNTAYEMVEDRELYFRIGKIANFANLKEELYQLRIHSESVVAKKQKIIEKKCNNLCWKYLFDKDYPFAFSNFCFLCLQRLAYSLIPASCIKRLYLMFR